MITHFNQREQAKREQASHNRFLVGSNIDIFKHTPRLADIVVTKAHKKKTLLEEILGMSSSGQGRPIIVVPASEYPGNLTLKNVSDFMSEGKYVDHKQANKALS